jgi:ribulose-phosphate 3-epimerase
MIQDPDRYLEEFSQAGSSYLTVHQETCPHLHRTIHVIKDLGVKAGVALNPTTPLSTLDWILEDLDFILIMSVNPGFGGQTFIPQTIDKIRNLKSMIDAKNPAVSIGVDGGVNEDTIGPLAKAGANIFVAGSAIFGSADYAERISKFRSLIET